MKRNVVPARITKPSVDFQKCFKITPKLWSHYNANIIPDIVSRSLSKNALIGLKLA